MVWPQGIELVLGRMVQYVIGAHFNNFHSSSIFGLILYESIVQCIDEL